MKKDGKTFIKVFCAKVAIFVCAIIVCLAFFIERDRTETVTGIFAEQPEFDYTLFLPEKAINEMFDEKGGFAYCKNASICYENGEYKELEEPICFEENNILYVSQGEGEELFSSGLISESFNWIPEKPQEEEFDCFAKFRYRQPEQKCTVKIKKDCIEVEFAEKQRAITEGQFAVFYDGDKCIGGGVIEKAVF